MRPEEEESVSFYAKSGYKAINPVLRGNQEYDPEFEEAARAAVENLDAIIADSVTQEEVTVYRGVKATPDEIALDEGDEFTDNAFQSTSLRESVSRSVFAGRDGTVFEIRVPKGTNAAYTGYVQYSAHESEVLLPRGTTYRVIGKSDGRIILEVVKK